MLAKLAAIVQSKIALAAIGGALVVGGGATAAAAATGNLHIPGVSQEHGSADNGKHAHTVGINGTLKAYDGAGKTITVEGKKADQGDDQGDDKTPTATKTPEAHETETPEATGTEDASNAADGTATSVSGTFTIAVNSDTKVNGSHASALADLANAIGSKVQVQAQDDGKGNLTAWKVTVTGDDSNNDNGPGDNHGGQAHNVAGTVGTVNVAGLSFTVQPASGSPVTVHVSTQTKFAGGAHGLGDLKGGMKVQVQGTTQADGSIAATSVEVTGSADH